MNVAKIITGMPDPAAASAKPKPSQKNATDQSFESVHARSTSPVETGPTHKFDDPEKSESQDADEETETQVSLGAVQEQDSTATTSVEMHFEEQAQIGEPLIEQPDMVAIHADQASKSASEASEGKENAEGDTGKNRVNAIRGDAISAEADAATISRLPPVQTNGDGPPNLEKTHQTSPIDHQLLTKTASAADVINGGQHCVDAEMSVQYPSAQAGDERELSRQIIEVKEKLLPPVPSIAESSSVRIFRLTQNAAGLTVPEVELTWPEALPTEKSSPSAAQMLVQIRQATPTLVAPIAAPKPNSVEEKVALQMDTAELRTSEMRMESSRAVPQAQSVVASRADLPVQVARQIAEILHRAPDRAVELTLSPAELGRVRMTLAPSEAGIAVAILTERPETLDLMRRNIESLENAMTALGYGDVSFSFDSQAERETNDKEETMNPDVGGSLSQEDADDVANLQPTLLRMSDGHMDIRI